MRIDVQLFAIAKQRAGAATVAVELPEGATVGRLREAIAAQHPSLAGLLPGMMVAVDDEYAGDDHPIEAESSVALIPPVSGG